MQGGAGKLTDLVGGGHGAQHREGRPAPGIGGKPHALPFGDARRQVEKARANPKLAGWFVGQVMKATGGKANPKAVNELVAAKLGL